MTNRSPQVCLIFSFVCLVAISVFGQKPSNIVSGSVVSSDSIPPTPVEEIFLKTDLTDESFKSFLTVPPPVIEEGSGGVPVWVWIGTGVVGGGALTYFLTKKEDTPPSSDPPIARDDQLSITCNGSGSINVITNDTGEGITVSNTSSVPGIEISHTGGGVITISNVGAESFSFNYSIRDNQGRNASATVNVTVITGTITAMDDNFVYEISGTVTGNVLTNDSGAGIIVISHTDASNGILSISGSGDLVYTPNATFCGQETINYTIRDECGQETSANVILTSNDSVSPIISCPPDMEVTTDPGQCFATISYEVTSSDNCNSESITQTQGLESGAQFPIGETINTFVATDASGNTAECSFKILVVYNEAPAAVCQNTEVSLNENGTAQIDASMIDAGSSDACGEVTITVSQTDFDCSHLGENTVSLTVTNEIGNTSSCEAIVIVRDNQKPSITCPQDLEVFTDPESCFTTVSYSVSSSDNCGNETIEQTSGLSSGSQFPLGETVNTFVVTDASGNSAECSFRVIVSDNIIPSINCPADREVNTDSGQCFATVTYEITTSDNCTNETWVQTQGLESGSQFPMGETINTFVVTDANGNSAECSFKIIVSDNISPNLVCPSETSIQCSSNAEPDITGHATATDNCSSSENISISYEDDRSGLTGCNNTGIIIRTWTAVDELGNTANCIQTIQVEDTIEPGLFCPPDVEITCDSNYDPSVTGTAESDDLCGDTTIEYEDDLTGLSGCDNTGNIERSWTATDACGNTTICVQIITVSGLSDPFTITCPNDVEIICGSNYDPEIIGTASAENACSDVSITYEDDSSGLSGCDQTGSVLRTWTATDACGNTQSCTQTISITGVSDPLIINCPDDIEILCGMSFEPEITGIATTENACSDINISYVDDLSQLTGCNGTGSIFRTWIATDACGNTQNCTQLITIPIDNQLPQINCPSDIVISCSESMEPSNTGFATSIDNCSTAGQITIIYEDTAIDPSVCNPSFIRSWTAIDACGNAISCEQQITIVDNSSPVIACPADIHIPCTMDPDPAITGSPIVSDDCGAEQLGISFVDEFVPDGDCSGILIRIWTIVDNCGNSTSCDQTIFLDALACDFSFTLETKNADCGANNGEASVTILPGTGAQGPFSVEWSDGQVGTQIGNLNPGFYQVTVIDNGIACIQIQDFEIQENPPDIIQGVETIPISCDGTGGNILIDIQSPGDGPITVSIFLPGGGIIEIPDVPNNQTFFLSEWLSNPPPGDYIITVTDLGSSDGCAQSILVSLPQSPPLIFNLVGQTPPSSPSAMDGQAVFHVEPSGIPPFSVFIDEMLIGSANSHDFFIDGFPVGEFAVFIVDATGCMSNTVLVFMEPGSTFQLLTSPIQNDYIFPTENILQYQDPEHLIKEDLTPEINPMISWQTTVIFEWKPNFSFQLDFEYAQGSWNTSRDNEMSFDGNFESGSISPYLRWSPDIPGTTGIFVDFGIQFHESSFKTNPSTYSSPPIFHAGLNKNLFCRSGLNFDLSNQSILQIEVELIPQNQRWIPMGELRFQHKLFPHNPKFNSKGLDQVNFMPR